MNGTAMHGHLEDDELLRFVDGEVDSRRDAWADHIAACSRCAAEAESLRTDTHLVSLWLERAALEAGGGDAASLFDAEVAPEVIRLQPRRRNVSPWLRAAAVLALLATPVAAIPALRQWVVETVRGPADNVTPAVLSAPEPGPADAEIIRFVPAAGAFIVEVEAVQSAGELQLERAPGAEAVLQPDAVDGALPIVSAAVLRIRNNAQDAAGYTLQLPAAVSSVTVRLPGRSVVIERGQLDAGARVPLH